MDRAEKKVRVYKQYGEGIWQKMPPAQPGDWLHWKDEPGQTFQEYLAEVGKKTAPRKSVIYLQPLGEFDQDEAATLQKMRHFTSIYFDRPVRLQKALPLPIKAYNKARQQYDGSYILRQLRKEVPSDALARVGITMQDLYSGELNFVFGLGSPGLRTGIYSLHRYRQTYHGHNKHNTMLRRALKVVAHEIGHIFHIDHCIFYKCVMNGSNSLPESDSRPMELCPVDAEKLKHYLGYDPDERYRKLEQFYRREGMNIDEELIKKIRNNIKRTGNAKNLHH